MLSKKYEISIIQVITNKNDKVSKKYDLVAKNKLTDEKTKETFFNKKQLVSWLMCLE